MDRIAIVPIKWLRHHPENPRQDLGDLSELTESIRQNGILQNLTVVPSDESDENGYGLLWVIIGNRRLEAAKAAGLTELPCVLSDMDHTQQILTMMQENMLRADLTPWEQAHGFQMMMDLGLTSREIGKRTGFSQATVERRLRMAEMDGDLLKSACEATNTERQVTLRDFERLSRVDSIKERNALLKEIGNNAFEWRLKRALEVQQANKVRDYIKEILREAGIKKLKNDNDRFTPEYRQRYADSVDMSAWDPGKPLVPDHEGELYWYMDDTRLNFYSRTNIAPEPKKTREEKDAEQQRKASVAKKWEEYDRDTETARKLRRDYAEQLTAGAKNAGDMLRAMMTAAVLAEAMYCGPTIKRMCEALGVKPADGYGSQGDVLKGLRNLKTRDVPRVIAAFFDSDRRTGYGYGVKPEPPKYMRDELVDAYYDWLTDNGYHLSETEEQLRNGTHECYQVDLEEGGEADG